MQARDLANIYTESVSEQISHILSASYPIAAFIQNQQGDPTGFENIAETMLPHYPGLNSLQLTRGGIIEYIVPLAGNEAALGKDIFTNPRISKETLLAKQSGNLVLTGPFDLYQGVMGVIGRLPIYLYDDSKNKTFWGFASTLIKLPDILNSNTFKALVNDGYSYQLSRIHPETHQIQIIDQSTAPLNGDAVKAIMAVPGSRWYLSVTPTQGWITPNTLLFQTLLAVLFSLFLTISLDSLRQQQRHSRELEQQVRQRTKTLDEHLKRLKMSFSTAKQRSFDLDLTTGVININNEYSSSEGFNTDSISTTLKAYKASIHPEDIVRASQAYDNCLTTGTAHNIEFREQLDNQTWTWTWVNVSGLVVEWDREKKTNTSYRHSYRY